MRIYKLLSLPPNVIRSFYALHGVNSDEWFASSDPEGSHLGSGGGTAWLMECWRKHLASNNLSDGKRIIIHAGGQSRRLPAYASIGKILTPIPVFRWERGQRYDQNLLSLQMPLYEQMMSQAPRSLKTLVASGDVLIRTDEPLPHIPEADVVCFGLWVDPQLASRHGVFVSRQESPDTLAFMLQKPAVKTLDQLSATHFFLMDIGLWLLSDKALATLEKKAAERLPYDLYTEFGGALGAEPSLPDDDLKDLTVAILPLPGGEFYHYGTSAELISSTAAIQNRVIDQRRIMQRRIRPNDTLFVQNCQIDFPLTEANESVWVENACVPSSWRLTSRNIVTGVPRNNWNITLNDGICLDIEPLAKGGYVVRPYGFYDTFKGDYASPHTSFLNQPLAKWIEERGLDESYFPFGKDDLQTLPLFPVITSVEEMERVVNWMISDPSDEKGRELWVNNLRLSAEQIVGEVSLTRIQQQRLGFARYGLEKMIDNYEKSVVYQLDLDYLAQRLIEQQIPMPSPLPLSAAVDKRIRNHMLRAHISELLDCQPEASREARQAEQLMRNEIFAAIPHSRVEPRMSVYEDQIIWGRSPVRIDLAGGWTDTPPYSLVNGGSVVNMAVTLNGQLPIQVYVKPSKEKKIIIRSIDMGQSETLTSFDQLRTFNCVGSPFSIPKAALALAGFLPEYSVVNYRSLAQQLEAFGSGIEITLLSAIPAGSGLGTSSILAATLLGSLSDFCGLCWTENDICTRTLALEQLLTTGGGWQDQYGGMTGGIKLLTSSPGALQIPAISWLPDNLFTSADYGECHLLYYTGITRVAKNILNRVVGGMFLNSGPELRLLEQMREHARLLAQAIQRNDFMSYGRLVRQSWEYNKMLDASTAPQAVNDVIKRISDWCYGYKLPGAGGGGFLYMVAKDHVAAARIKESLTNNPPNHLARFVELTLSKEGFKVSRS